MQAARTIKDANRVLYSRSAPLMKSSVYSICSFRKQASGFKENRLYENSTVKKNYTRFENPENI